jgi:uncharacterized protein (TIGR02452 family)
MSLVLIHRKLAAAYGAEAVAITHAGAYTAPSGRSVTIADDVRAARDGTITYAPDDHLDAPGPARVASTVISVENTTTLAAAGALARAGHDAAALNFASAKNPGGGFLNGARAQEESLCRASALYACLEGSPMYAWHRSQSDPVYASWVIWSPRVPVFRGDDGELLEEPFACSFLTSPAPNAGAAIDRDTRWASRIQPALRERVARVLGVAAQHGHDALVLGAWGCGVFRCDPAMVADELGRALEGRFAGCFAKVVFAIVDERPERSVIAPFEARFRRYASAAPLLA